MTKEMTVVTNNSIEQKMIEPKSFNKLYRDFGYNTDMRQQQLEKIMKPFIEQKKTIGDLNNYIIEQLKNPFNNVLQIISKRDGRHLQFFISDCAKYYGKNKK